MQKGCTFWPGSIEEETSWLWFSSIKKRLTAIFLASGSDLWGCDHLYDMFLITSFSSFNYKIICSSLFIPSVDIDSMPKSWLDFWETAPHRSHEDDSGGDKRPSHPNTSSSLPLLAVVWGRYGWFFSSKKEANYDFFSHQTRSVRLGSTLRLCS